LIIRRIFDRGDDLQGAAVGAVFHVDIERPFEQPGPDYITVIASNTSGRAKKAHAFTRVEDVALCPSQDFGFAVIHGTSQANPIQKLVLTGVSDQLWVQPAPLPLLTAFQFCKSLTVCFYVWP
jgi:hypothetical protein